MIEKLIGNFVKQKDIILQNKNKKNNLKKKFNNKKKN